MHINLVSTLQKKTPLLRYQNKTLIRLIWSPQSVPTLIVMQAVLLCLLLNKTALVQPGTTQVCCNSVCYFQMCAACFGYPQAGQYKNLTVVMLHNVKTYKM
jgi:hypothetical protein